jgi:hypothetical protein
MPERRQVPRYISALKGQLTEGRSEAGSGVKILTLSISGACVEGVGRLKRGEKCELKIDWSQAVRVDADVVWKDKRNRAGLKFLPMDQDAEMRLKEICSTLKLEPLQPPQVLPPVPRKTKA